MTEGKLQVAQEHIESLEQQLADAEKKVSDANQRGIAFITYIMYVLKNIADLVAVNEPNVARILT